jgi:hypothetical protein
MNRPSTWILGGIFLVVLGICVAGAILAIAANDPDVDVNLGDDEFQIHRIDDLARRIADDAPEAYGDPTGGNRPIIVQHLGDDVDTGWVVILAVAPGSETCAVNWDADDDVFRDCEGETYPADGTGLEQFPWRVDDHTLFIDLGRGPSSEPSPTTTSTTILVTGDTTG